MKISDLDQPRIGDIVEFETDPDTVVEGLIVGETEDGYIYEFSESGYIELDEACTYGKYYCSTDKMYKCRKGPKQSRTTEAYPGYIQKGEELDDATKKIQANLDKRIKQVDSPKKEIERLKLRQNAEHGSASLKRQAETQARIRELEKQIKDNKDINEAANAAQQAAIAIAKKKKQDVDEAHPNSKIYDKCWDGYKKVPGKKRGEKGSCVEESSGVTEAEYQGREVPLGRPMRGDVKKFKVYVRDPKSGNVKKINFGHGGSSARRLGQKTMRIKKSNPARRRNFRARHRCNTAKNRMTARYWSCRAW